jgi:hypothetical protein
VYQGGIRALSSAMTATRLARRTALLVPILALGLAGTAAAAPPELPGGLPPQLTTPLLTPMPGSSAPQLRQFDCRTYYLRTIDDKGTRVETVEICLGFEAVPR